MLTIFDKVLKGEIPVKKVFEDDHTLAFHDINPQAPTHILVIPKVKISGVREAEEEHVEALGRMLLTAKKVAEIAGVAKQGYRIVFNNGDDAGQTVAYVHCHVIGGRTLAWPPG